MCLLIYLGELSLPLVNLSLRPTSFRNEHGHRTVERKEGVGDSFYLSLLYYYYIKYEVNRTTTGRHAVLFFYYYSELSRF